MILVPLLPLGTQACELVDFCLHFRSTAGFISVYELKLAMHLRPGAAYEATEQLHSELFGRRRYPDREVFEGVLAGQRKR